MYPLAAPEGALGVFGGLFCIVIVRGEDQSEDAPLLSVALTQM